MLLLIELALRLCVIALMTALFWSASPWFAIFAWSAIGAVAVWDTRRKLRTADTRQLSK